MTSGHSRMVCLCDPGTRIQRQKENRVICVIRAKKKINHATLMHRERTKLLDNDNKLLEYLQQGQKVTTSPIPRYVQFIPRETLLFCLTGAYQ